MSDQSRSHRTDDSDSKALRKELQESFQLAIRSVPSLYKLFETPNPHINHLSAEGMLFCPWLRFLCYMSLHRDTNLYQELSHFVAPGETTPETNSITYDIVDINCKSVFMLRNFSITKGDKKLIISKDNFEIIEIE